MEHRRENEDIHRLETHRVSEPYLKEIIQEKKHIKLAIELTYSKQEKSKHADILHKAQEKVEK